MATGRAFCKQVEVINEAQQTILATVVYVVPVPAKRAMRDPRNVPGILYNDVDDPGHGGYSAAELAGFKLGTFIEVLETIQYDSTGDPPTDKSNLKAKMKARFQDLVAAQNQRAPANGFSGLNYDAATNTFTDLPQ